MIEPKLPENEAERLEALERYAVLDTEAEQAFDDLTRIASDICGTPIALVSLIDADRQWFKSRVGLDATETPRRVAFCAHAILNQDDVLVIPDSLEDPRFDDNPLAVGEPHVRFYAGAPLVTPEGLPMGTLCVIDHEPRRLSEEQIDTLRALSRQVVSQLELRRKNASLSELAESLGRSNEELRQFTSIAAHDLKEPARKVVSFSQLLEQDLGEDLPPRAAEDLSFICSSAERMLQLVSDLLKLSRAGSAEIACTPVDLKECVRLAVDALALRVEETQAEIELDPLPFLRGDATLLTQLFQNLIGNALKFVADGRPRIHITCALENGGTTFGVKDNGIGMEPKYTEQIFAPFQRLHGASVYEGTGIGLAIARKVVDRHGGRIWVDSRPGAGSHFQFTLAGAEAEARVSENAAA